MRLFIFLITLCICTSGLAQDTLPKLSVNNISNHVVISWTNPYTYLTTINIQRSFDSVKNFKTIGSVLDVKNKKNGYVDSKPPSTKMFYRVFLSFEGGTYIFTKSYRPFIDTIKVIPGAGALQQNTVIPWFVPSTRVYTGKDNNVIIFLPLAREKKYTLKFFEENGAPVLDIEKIPDTYLTLERVNFLHSGIFNFDLYEDGLLIEKDKIYIPKDGKVINGNSEQGRR